MDNEKKSLKEQLYNLPSLLMFALGLGLGVCLILYPLLVAAGIAGFLVMYFILKKRENIADYIKTSATKGKGNRNTNIDEKKEKFMKEMEEYMETKRKKQSKEVLETE